jgi:hypothetical protein
LCLAAAACDPTLDWFTDGREIELIEQARLLRELFGNAFRPAAVDSSWLTPSVVQLAKAIYNEKTFDLMPVLADALEDAGCTNQDLLRHCRQQEQHIRGCWLVDVILGKK